MCQELSQQFLPASLRAPISPQKLKNKTLPLCSYFKSNYKNAQAKIQNKNEKCIIQTSIWISIFISSPRVNSLSISCLHKVGKIHIFIVLFVPQSFFLFYFLLRYVNKTFKLTSLSCFPCIRVPQSYTQKSI